MTMLLLSVQRNIQGKCAAYRFSVIAVSSRSRGPDDSRGNCVTQKHCKNAIMLYYDSGEGRAVWLSSGENIS